MTSQKATVSSERVFINKAQATAPFDDGLKAVLDEIAPVPSEASGRGPDVPADIIRPSKFILGPF
jgi:hypothetical protein